MTEAIGQAEDAEVTRHQTRLDSININSKNKAEHQTETKQSARVAEGQASLQVR